MKRGILLSLLMFNAATAIGGGLMLALHLNAPPDSWLEGTIFSSYLLPGLLLAVVVGGSALAALLTMLRNQAWAPFLGLLSGFIMCTWILGEIGAVQHYSWLQLVYMLTGGLLIGLDYTDSKHRLAGQ